MNNNEDNTCTNNCTSSLPLELVPVELLKRIAAFLSYQDALRFSRSNHQLYNLLSMSTIRLPSKLLTSQAYYGHFVTGDRPHWCCNITPILLKNRVHTVVLEGRWKDQGFGNSKGKLYVVATTSTNAVRLVVTSALAPHALGRLHLEFNIHDDEERYALWYSVGSGGGHSLHISDLRIKVFLYDMGSRYLCRNFLAMEQRGALRGGGDTILGGEKAFHFQMLQGVARTLLQQLERNVLPDINMTSFLDSTGIDVTKESLLALEQLAWSFLERCNCDDNDDNNDLTSEEEDRIRRLAFPPPPPLPRVARAAQENNDNDDDDDVDNNNDDDDEAAPPVAFPAADVLAADLPAAAVPVFLEARRDPRLQAAAAEDEMEAEEWLDMMEEMHDDDEPGPMVLRVPHLDMVFDDEEDGDAVEEA